MAERSRAIADPVADKDKKARKARSKSKKRSESVEPTKESKTTATPAAKSKTSTTKDGVVLLKNESVNKKWQNALIRGIYSILMVAGFALILYLGHAYICALVAFLQLFIYTEVIDIGAEPGKQKNLPLNKFLHWWFLGTTEYFLYGESLIHYFSPDITGNIYLAPFAEYHRFISFILYVSGLVLFVLSLRKGEYQFQFSQFGWTHMVLLIVICQSHLMINNTFEGIFWFILPAALIICNDIMAYIFGFFFGKTPLISLSPKKTWEGYMGALFATTIFAWFLSGLLANYPFVYCPISDLREATEVHFQHNCTPDYVFTEQVYSLPRGFVKFVSTQIVTAASYFGKDFTYKNAALINSTIKTLVDFKFTAFPVQFHSISLALFSSVVAPFGGFFASGLKRAFNIKDFGHSIPGHGGITDRMDCQLMMASFSFIYLQTFVKAKPFETLVTVGIVFDYAIKNLNRQQLKELVVALNEYLQ